MYAVKGFHDQPLHFINTIYFHAKTAGDRHYKTVVIILLLLFFIKLSLLFLMIYLSIQYIIFEVENILQNLSKIHITEADKFLTELQKDAVYINDRKQHTIAIKKFNVSGSYYYEQKIHLIEHSEDDETVLSLNDMQKYVQKVSKDTDGQQLKQQVVNIKHYLDITNRKEIYIIKLPGNSKWKVNLPSVIVVNILFYLSLFCIHIISIVRLIHYNIEVLDNGYLWLDVGCSIIFLIVFFVIYLYFVRKILIYKCYKCCKCCKDKDHNYSKDEDHNVDEDHNFYSVVAAKLVALNITYIASYYMPYMFLAFSFNPLITIATYFVFVLYNLSGYFFVSTMVQHLQKIFLTKFCWKDSQCYQKMSNYIMLL